MRAATMRRPAASKRARILPIRFLRTASGLMMDRVRSIAMRVPGAQSGRRRQASGRRRVRPPIVAADVAKKLNKKNKLRSNPQRQCNTQAQAADTRATTYASVPSRRFVAQFRLRTLAAMRSQNRQRFDVRGVGKHVDDA